MFTYILTPLGAVLLSTATTHYLSTNGRILGCSSIIERALVSPFALLADKDGASESGYTESLALTLGMLAAIPVIRAVLGGNVHDFAVEGGMELGLKGMALAGALVGIGTKWASGCTSGHMLCGLPRLSIRSLVSTGIFFITAVFTTNAMRTYPTTISSLPPGALAPVPVNLPTYLLLAGSSAAALSLTSLLPKCHASKLVSAGLTGINFALGLSISGMTSPAKILSFLSLHLRTFDPSLALIIAFAVVPNLLIWQTDQRIACAVAGDNGIEARLGGKIAIPRSTERNFALFGSRDIDLPLVIGSITFGIGWGMAGICPGPGVIGAVVNGAKGLSWMGGFLVGRVILSWVLEKAGMLALAGLYISHISKKGGWL